MVYAWGGLGFSFWLPNVHGPASRLPATKSRRPTKRPLPPPNRPAQPAPAGPGAAGPGAQPAAKPPVPATTGDAPGPKTRAFEAIFAQWKQVLADLRRLLAESHDATPERSREIADQYGAKLKEGFALRPKLIDAAREAFAESPKPAPQLTEFLLAIADDAYGHDRFEEALSTAELLIKKGQSGGVAYYIAGLAAYSMDQFDTAAKYLPVAQKQGKFSPTDEGYLDSIPTYKQYWAREQKLRAAEAKADDLPRVLMKTTKGDIELELFENEAPNTVANFISLVDKGFYNGLTFHRVLEHFMAQGGDPTGSGSGGPGYSIPCECYQPNARMHFRGSLSMAHAGRDTGGSQFFLTFIPTGHLNGHHTVFGRVLKGMDVLAKLQRRDPSGAARRSPTRSSRPRCCGSATHTYEPKKVGEK